MTDEPGVRPPALVGSWRKVDAPECAQRYPEVLTFAPSTYRGARGAAQGFISWDAGIYNLEDPGRLVLSTASDELVAYQMHLEGDVLQLVDPDGCRFSYQRIPAP
jgi:hypothetical protein